MKKQCIASIIIILMLGTTACTKSDMGTGIGAAAGAGLGYAISNNGWGAAAGAVGGALIGKKVGESR